MNKNQEDRQLELERIILQHCSAFTTTLGNKELGMYIKNVGELVTAILSAGFINKNELERRMISSRTEDIIYPNGSKWKCLIYKDDTKEQCEWICYQHIKPFLDAGFIRLENVELERIIFNAVMDDLTKETREYLAKYILDRGYVKLSDVELDEEKIMSIIHKLDLGETSDNYLICNSIAHAIAQSVKEIVRKE